MINILLVFFISLISSYLAGSIPFALLLSKLKHIDIRRVGSGNIGATNVFRSVSKPLGVLTFIGDFLKGLLPTLIIPILATSYGLLEPSFTHNLLLQLTCGTGAILGHNWSIFIGFKGGKGVAVSTGVLVAIAPTAALIGLIIWILIFFSSGYVSLASIIGAIVVAAVSWRIYASQTIILPTIFTAFCALIVWRHKANIKRLISGTESRFQIWQKLHHEKNNHHR